MPKTITFTDITMEHEYHIFEEVQADGSSLIFGDVGYVMESAEGLRISRGKRVGPLTGTTRTRALALFQDLKALAKTEEGI